jgi:hypothetical protein
MTERLSLPAFWQAVNVRLARYGAKEATFGEVATKHAACHSADAAAGYILRDRRDVVITKEQTILENHIDMWKGFYEEHLRELRNAEPGADETKARNKAIAAEAVLQAMRHYEKRLKAD